MTTPNYLQVETALKRATAFASSNPELTSTSHYLGLLEEMQARFAAATAETDSVYAGWRLRRGDRMRAFRDMRLEYDRVVELADEHAYDDVPRKKIVYTEEDSLLELIDATCAWLSSKGDEWAWTADKEASLKAQKATAMNLREDCDARFQNYTVVVKYRVAAYADAVALLREYHREAARDARGSEAVDGFSLEVR